LSNLPYILPLIDEMKPASIIHFGCGQSSLADELAKATGARTARYDPAVPEHSNRPDGKFDLIVNVDALQHAAEDELGTMIADMAAFAKHAIIIIDADAPPVIPGAGEAPATLRDQDWWAERLGAHFPYLEPIHVRSKRGAAFKTWKSQESRALPNFIIYVREEIKYKIRKLKRA
jgi:hypothetical protein